LEHATPNFNEQDKGCKDALKLACEGKKKHFFNFKSVGRTQAAATGNAF
jgi:hypothetical protein